MLSAHSAGSASAKSARSLFIFGFGYLATGLANQLLATGWAVSGTCRSSEKQKELQQQGFGAFLFDTDHMTLGLGQKGLEALRQASHVLVSISPTSEPETCPITWILGREFKLLRENVEWIGFLSTTSVYGEHEGDWVTEESETRAVAGSGHARRRAELAWLRFGGATGLPVHVFRLAGIYGPGRSAIDALQKQKVSKRTGKRFTSRCHVYDICQTLVASMNSPDAGQIYNVADDDPTNREDVLRFVQQSLLRTTEAEASIEINGVSANEAQEQRRPEQPVSSQRRSSGEKRVSNAKIKQALGVRLRFPTFREGLEAIHQGDLTPFAENS